MKLSRIKAVDDIYENHITNDKSLTSSILMYQSLSKRLYDTSLEADNVEVNVLHNVKIQTHSKSANRSCNITGKFASCGQPN